MNYKIIPVLLLSSFFFLFSCTKKKEGDDAESYNFLPMVQNIGENIILVNYQSFNADCETLNSSFNAFSTNITEQNLVNLKTAFAQAYLSWQKVAVYDYGSGPSFSAFARTYINTYPTSASKIEANISNGGYDLATSGNIDAQGFAAIDYLLFNQDNATLISDFTNNANRLNYLGALVNKINSLSSELYQAWNPAGGNYIAGWNESNGISAGASTAVLYNQFTYELELIKKAKVGIPGGALLGITNPSYVESYYGQYSFELLRENIQNLQVIFNGGDGSGFDDYLDFLERGDLKNNINQQFTTVLNRIDSFTLPLSTEISNNNPDVMLLYGEIQQLVIYAKTEMASVVGVEISYQDNDND